MVGVQIVQQWIVQISADKFWKKKKVANSLACLSRSPIHICTSLYQMQRPFYITNQKL